MFWLLLFPNKEGSWVFKAKILQNPVHLSSKIREPFPGNVWVVFSSQFECKSMAHTSHKFPGTGSRAFQLLKLTVTIQTPYCLQFN